MKAYTDLNQSKKLAEILPMESADMHYVMIDTVNEIYSVGLSNYIGILPSLPCWSLAALLDALPSSTLDSSNDHYYRLHCMERFTEWYDNAVDACYEMIIKLHELKML